MDPPGQRAKKGAPGRVPNRQATEAALEDAALTLLRRDGVLAGVNLREVADAAGVNRGLVYHYYGSRGKLLRAALARHGQRNLKRLRALADLPGPQRWRRFLRTILRDPEAIELTTLLLMDGTARIRATPLRDETMAAIRRDVEAGELPEDLDLVAFHTVMVTAPTATCSTARRSPPNTTCTRGARPSGGRSPLRAAARRAQAHRASQSAAQASGSSPRRRSAGGAP